MRRFISVLIVIISLMSFFITPSFARGIKKQVKKEHVVKKKAHKVVKGEAKHVKKRHKSVRKVHSTGHKGHSMKKKVIEEKEDSRIKVN
jgi:hypothetical protein